MDKGCAYCSSVGRITKERIKKVDDNKAGNL